MYINNRRQFQRVQYVAVIRIIIGSQLVVNGKLRDLSVKSAFVDLNNSIYLAPNDDVLFEIPIKDKDGEQCIKGGARVSRVVQEGLAIFFTEMDKESTKMLEDLVAGNNQQAMS